MHPDVLSHKLHAKGAILTTTEVASIVTTLARWGAVGSEEEARELLALMTVPAHALPRQDWAAGPLAALPPSKPRAVASQTGRLTPVLPPAPSTPLVGRAPEVAAAKAALADCRLVTLTGPGGIGKTRVALAAAAGLASRFSDGVAFADLAPVDMPSLLAVTLARAVGLQPQSVAAEGQLAAALSSAELLLVADNMEHLTSEAPLLGRLLAAAPGLRLLVTSRIPLRLYGECQLRIPPLDVSGPGAAPGGAAVELFLSRVRAAGVLAPEGQELAAVAEICAAVDGLPLAIELAAAQTRLYPPHAVLARLTARQPLLTTELRDVPARQQTLGATLDWSYALLPPAAQGLFASLGVLTGPFDPAAAAALRPGESEAAVTAALAELADHSLADVIPGDPPRFRLLETIREYALARLAEAGQETSTRERHLQHYRAVAEAAQCDQDGPRLTASLGWLRDNLDNVHAALQFAGDRAEADGAWLDHGLRLAVATATVWRLQGSLAVGSFHLERLLALDDRLRASSLATRARALLEAAGLACFRGHYPRTDALARQALAECQVLNDLPGQSRAHRYLGEAALALGDLATAESHIACQVALAERARDSWALADARNMLGTLLRYQGRHNAATAQLRAALRLAHALGDLDVKAAVLNSLGEVARDAGQPTRALRLFRAALRTRLQIGGSRGMAYDLEGIAAATVFCGEPRSALICLGAARALRETASTPLPPAEQTILGMVLEAPLAALGQAEQDDAIREGRDLPLASIIAIALGRDHASDD